MGAKGEAGATERAIARLPPHLRRFVVSQEYEAYTPRDHAVWRHIMRRLARHLPDRAHPDYLTGLRATGIGAERIASLDDMNERLATLGWSAVGVRGFIPPAVFTELQSHRVLAIAADIRTHEHMEYTPAPDIVHESAGHAPLLANQRYAAYLQRSGVVGLRALGSSEDEAVFHAVRHLSVVKEDPAATPLQVQLAEERLHAASASRRYVSEGTRASRLYWWTAEYGLVGSLNEPRLYGAGLLSSVGEAEACLGPQVKRIPLSLEAIETDYDITRMQPQLFVARDFDHLFEVLEEFEATLAFRRGGDYGLEQAIRSRTVNHLVLSDGRELTGRVVGRIAAEHAVAPGLTTALARIEGPILLSQQGVAVEKPITGDALVVFGRGHATTEGPFGFELPSGLFVTGFALGGGEVVNLRGHLGGRPLDLPSCTRLFFTETLPSVAAGAADRAAWDEWFGELNAFAEGDAEARARARKAAALDPALAHLYREVRQLREAGAPEQNPQAAQAKLADLQRQAAAHRQEWLLREELAELEEILGAQRSATSPSASSSSAA
ncbi:MAG TPA: aromatic amino acid hydroxylase [Polyangia bacterium]